MDKSKNERIYLETPRSSQPFPSFSKPFISGTFSLDSSRNYIEGPQFIKYLKLPKNPQRVHYDLESLNSTNLNDSINEEDELARQKQQKETNELVHLLTWINKNDQCFNKNRPHFIFYRGLMSKILSTPYERQEGWKIGAIYKNGSIYLRNIDTLENLQKRQEQESDPKQRKMCSWGYNFEYFLLSDSMNNEPVLPEPGKQEKEECNFVFMSKLGSHKLLYAGEVDGIWLSGETDKTFDPNMLDNLNDKNSRLVELKTSREFQDPVKMTRSFCRYKLQKWFCQSYTVGISHVIAGFRDDEGVVSRLQIFPIKEISNNAKDWFPNVCFNFLDIFLTTVKKIVGENGDFVFIIEFIPHLSNGHSKCIQVTKETLDTSSYALKNLL